MNTDIGYFIGAGLFFFILSLKLAYEWGYKRGRIYFFNFVITLIDKKQKERGLK